MSKDFRDRLQRYSNGDRLHYPGHLEKDVCRVNDNTDEFDAVWICSEEISPQKTMKDSLYFRELFESYEDADKKSHYIFSLDKSLKPSSSGDRYIPVYVPCFLKRIGSLSAIYGEVVGSRLANALGVDTVFNLPINIYGSGKDVVDVQSSKMYTHIASVDFVRPREKFYTFKDLNLLFDRDTPIQEIFALCNKLPQRLRYKRVRVSREDIEQIKMDIAKQWLFKIAICADLDFQWENVGIICDDDGIVRLAPCFDMELLFQNIRFLDTGRNGVVEFENLMYIFNNMPEMAGKMLEKFDELHKSGKLDKIMRTVDLSATGDDWQFEDIVKRMGILKNLWRFSIKERHVQKGDADVGEKEHFEG